MKFGLKEKSIIAIQEIISTNVNITEAVLFGSRAKGNFKNGSDIDLALKGELSLKDILSLMQKLDELNLPHKFDLIIYNHIKEPALIDHIDRVGKIIYKKA